MTATPGILDEVLVERRRQDEKWGPQDHSDYKWLAILQEEIGEASEALLEADATGQLAEPHGSHLARQWRRDARTELVQAAAVVVAWIEAHDRAEVRRYQNAERLGIDP